MSNNDNNIFDEWNDAAREADHAREVISQGKFWQWSVGVNRFRVCPARKGSGLPPILLVQRHSAKIPGVERMVRFNCPRAMSDGNLPCSFCDKLMAMQRSTNATVLKNAEEWATKPRGICNAVPRNAPDNVGHQVPRAQLLKPMIMDLPQSVYAWIVTKIGDPVKGLGVKYAHHARGIDLYVEMIEGGPYGKKYKPVGTDPRGTTPLCDNEADLRTLAAGLHDLTKELYVPTPEEIEDMLAGVDVRAKQRAAAERAAAFGDAPTAEQRLAAGFNKPPPVALPPPPAAVVKPPTDDDDL